VGKQEGEGGNRERSRQSGEVEKNKVGRIIILINESKRGA
jgi:hypothetical protein